MDIASLLRDRRTGFTRIAVTRNHALPLATLLPRLGLFAEPGALKDIAPEIAVECLVAMLWKDLAYDDEQMPLATARQHARAFVDAYSGEDTIFFANGRWDRYRTQSGVAFTPLTPATLGAVVVAVHPAYAACLVVDDED